MLASKKPPEDWEKLATEWQERLYEAPKVTAGVLRAACRFMQPRHYRETIEERAAALNRCGYPLCDREIRAQTGGPPRTRVFQRRLYEHRDMGWFCGVPCLVASQYLESQLDPQPLATRSLETAAAVDILEPLAAKRVLCALSSQRQAPSAAVERAVAAAASNKQAQLDRDLQSVGGPVEALGGPLGSLKITERTRRVSANAPEKT